jgi:hypothetical protein
VLELEKLVVPAQRAEPLPEMMDRARQEVLLPVAERQWRDTESR